MVTAAHVLGLGKNQTFKKCGEYFIDNKYNNFLHEMRVRPLLGTLCYKIGSVGSIDAQDDVLFLQPEDQNAFKYVRPFELTESEPKTSNQVTAVGHPGTAAARHEANLVIDSVDAKTIIINKALDHGYSGGVIYDSVTHKAYGVITGITEKQTYIQRITPSMLKDIHWETGSTAFVRKFANNNK